MKENYYTIGEVSKIKGITIRALRFYDRIGLLKPSYIDPGSRYRYYHINQFVYLDIIKAARTMDISPNDLIPYFNEKNSKGLMDFLDRHNERILLKIDDLQKIAHGINEVKKTLHSAETAGRDNEAYIRHLPNRFAVTVPYDRRKSVEDIVLDYSELYLAVSRIGVIHTYQEGLLFSKNERDEFWPTYLCCFITDEHDNNQHYVVPEGNYICVCYTKEKAEQQQKRLWDYLQKNNLTPLDLVQVGLLTDLLAEETELIELQARV